MYIEATYQNDGDNAKLKLYLNGNGEVSCLGFYYHMYGDTIGALNVYSENHLIFSSTGNHGNLWIKAERTVYLDTTVSLIGRNNLGKWKHIFSIRSIAGSKVKIMIRLTIIIMGKYGFIRKKNPINRKHTLTKFINSNFREKFSFFSGNIDLNLSPLKIWQLVGCYLSL